MPNDAKTPSNLQFNAALASAVCADVRNSYSGLLLSEASARLCHYFPRLTVEQFLGAPEDTSISLFAQLVLPKEPSDAPKESSKPSGKSALKQSAVTNGTVEEISLDDALTDMLHVIQATGPVGIGVVALAEEMGTDLRVTRKMLRALVTHKRVRQMGKTKAAKYVSS